MIPRRHALALMAGAITPEVQANGEATVISDEMYRVIARAADFPSLMLDDLDWRRMLGFPNENLMRRLDDAGELRHMKREQWKSRSREERAKL